MTVDSPKTSDFDTAGRVLAAAEQLYAQKGLDDVNLREITTLARVNLASVNYHFGSKNGLQLALFEQLAERVNLRRRAELEAYLEAIPDGEVPQVEPIIDIFLSAYIGPGIDDQGILLARFMLKNRVTEISGFMEILERHFDPWAAEVNAALIRACPHLDPAEVYWRYFFMTSAVALAVADQKENARILRLSSNRVDVSRTAKFKRALTRFLVSSFAR